MPVQVDQLQRSLEKAVEQLTATTDPVKRSSACRDVHNALAGAVQKVAQLNRDAVSEMHTVQNKTYKEIAQTLGISQHRLYLMMRRERPDQTEEGPGGNGTAEPARPARRASKAAATTA
jgi:hypothetical protein